MKLIYQRIHQCDILPINIASVLPFTLSPFTSPSSSPPPNPFLLAASLSLFPLRSMLTPNMQKQNSRHQRRDRVVAIDIIEVRVVRERYRPFFFWEEMHVEKAYDEGESSMEKRAGREQSLGNGTLCSSFSSAELFLREIPKHSYQAVG